ncbi:hypothetical protein Q3G72_007980 [Acer saccharum]|nr:hypothetical protein Q3G72_007980 [Acer saccharum]
MVNGMLVYGWSIRSKVASFGWRSRRVYGTSLMREKGAQMKSGSGVSNVGGGCHISDVSKTGFSIGWILREPLNIEDDTNFRRRFDRGRLLVLIPHARPCPGKIKVAYGEDLFALRIFKDEAPADLAWLDNFLGLKKDNLNFMLEKGGVANEFVKEGGVASLSLCQVVNKVKGCNVSRCKKKVEELSSKKLNCLLENGRVDNEVFKERGEVTFLSLCQVVNEVEGCSVNGFKKSVEELSNVNLNFLLEKGGVVSGVVK